MRARPWHGVIWMVLFVAGIGAAAPAAAAKHLNDLLKAQDAVKAMQGPGDLRYFHPGLYVSNSRPGVKPADIVVDIQSAPDPITLHADEDGSIVIPDTAALRSENPAVSFNQPEGTVRLGIRARISAPPKQDFTYGLVQAMAAEVKTAYSRLSFLQRLMAGQPKPKSLDIHFGEGVAGAVTVSCDPALDASADKDGVAHLPWRPELPASRVIHATPMPTAMRLSLQR